MNRAPTYWATEQEYSLWFAHAVRAGLIDWPDIAYRRPYTLISDEQGRELQARADS